MRTTDSGASAGIAVSYSVTTTTQLSQGALQAQLETATSTGQFNSLLTSYAVANGAPAFVNATSTGLIVATESPTAAPVLAPSPTAAASAGLGAMWIGIIVAGGVVFLLAIAAALWYIRRQMLVGSEAQSGIIELQLEHSLEESHQPMHQLLPQATTPPEGIFRRPPVSVSPQLSMSKSSSKDNISSQRPGSSQMEFSFVNPNLGSPDSRLVSRSRDVRDI
jgi:hypothetical protein